MEREREGAVTTKPKRRGSEILEQIALTLVAGASILVGVLDFSGLLSGTLFANRVGSMTLVILGLVAGYLVLERRETVRKIARNIDELSERMGALESSAAQTAAFLAGFSGDRFSELKLVYGIRSLTSRISSGEVRADREHVFNMWSDLLREATTFFAFNYVSADEVWGTEGFAFNVAHAQQIARLKQGCSIKRVFVIDTEAEYEKLLPLMKSQLEAGMDVRWVLKKKLENRPMLTGYLHALGTWDFVCVDNEMVYRVYLDENRGMTSCATSRDREAFRKAMFVFTEGFQSAQAPEQRPS
jgi:hypothetical protein